LIGLLRHHDCDAARLLHGAGIDTAALATQVRLGMDSAPWLQPIKSLPPAGVLRRVLSCAQAEARKNGAAKVTTLHLLLAMTLIRKGKAFKYLEQARLGTETVTAHLKTTQSSELLDDVEPSKI